MAASYLSIWFMIVLSMVLLMTTATAARHSRQRTEISDNDDALVEQPQQKSKRPKPQNQPVKKQCFVDKSLCSKTHFDDGDCNAECSRRQYADGYCLKTRCCCETKVTTGVPVDDDVEIPHVRGRKSNARSDRKWKSKRRQQPRYEQPDDEPDISGNDY